MGKGQTNIQQEQVGQPLVPGHEGYQAIPSIKNLLMLQQIPCALCGLQLQ